MTRLFKLLYENPMRNLNNVTRYSGVFCMKLENDGYHTIDMMSMCMKIADLIESELSEDEIKESELDRKDLIYRCYLHDMDESLMGDIQRNIKYFNNEVYNSITKVVDEIMKSSFNGKIVNDISDSKNTESLNGLIVKMCDTLQSSMKIYEECKLGNFHFKRLIEENIGFVENLKKVITSSGVNQYPNPVRLKSIKVLNMVVEDFIEELRDEINKLNN